MRTRTLQARRAGAQFAKVAVSHRRGSVLRDNGSIRKNCRWLFLSGEFLVLYAWMWASCGRPGREMRWREIVSALFLCLPVSGRTPMHSGAGVIGTRPIARLALRPLAGVRRC